MYEKYEDHKNSGHLDTCPLCTEHAIEKFTYWKIVPNIFPYDKIAKIHHMLIPHRHVREELLTIEEKNELLKLKHSDVLQTYAYVIEAMPHKKSIPEHFHLHLIEPKDQI